MNEKEVEALRDYLRDPANRVTEHDPVSRHREAMKGIWAEGLRLAKGDPSRALEICTTACGSKKLPEEQSGAKRSHLDGVPSRVFGTTKPYLGEDKPQHFFKMASIAYSASLATRDYDVFTGWSPPMAGVGELAGKLAGKSWEALDWIRDKFGGNHGGYDHGDIVADDRGAEFGAALAGEVGVGDGRAEPTVGIGEFLYGPEDRPAPQTVEGSAGVDGGVDAPRDLGVDAGTVPESGGADSPVPDAGGRSGIQDAGEGEARPDGGVGGDPPDAGADQSGHDSGGDASAPGYFNVTDERGNWIHVNPDGTKEYQESRAQDGEAISREGAGGHQSRSPDTQTDAAARATSTSRGEQEVEWAAHAQNVPVSETGKWKDNTPSESIKRVADDQGRTRVLSFRANLSVDSDGAPSVLGIKRLREISHELRKEHPDWDQKTLQREAKNEVRAEAKAEGKRVDFDKREETALRWGGKSIDAATVPYISLPPELMKAGDIRKGDLALVRYGEASVYAIVADVGPSLKAGEASMATARGLGLSDDPHKGGLADRASSQSVEFTVLSGTGKEYGTNKKAHSFNDIQDVGRKAFGAARDDGMLTLHTEQNRAPRDGRADTDPASRFEGPDLAAGDQTEVQELQTRLARPESYEGRVTDEHRLGDLGREASPGQVRDVADAEERPRLGSEHQSRTEETSRIEAAGSRQSQEGGRALSTPEDANMTNERGEAVYADAPPRGDTGSTHAPDVSGASERPGLGSENQSWSEATSGDATRQQAGGETSGYTPDDANMTDERGDAVRAEAEEAGDRGGGEGSAADGGAASGSGSGGADSGGTP